MPQHLKTMYYRGIASVCEKSDILSRTVAWRAQMRKAATPKSKCWMARIAVCAASKNRSRL